jgi:uncharacterized membrane protein YfcA
VTSKLFWRWVGWTLVGTIVGGMVGVGVAVVTSNKWLERKLRGTIQDS